MSTPPNPLAQYRTYSYYHVLVACDTTETAEAIGLTQDPEIWFHPPFSASDDFQKRVKTINYNGKSGQYVVLINGATDARYVITNISWNCFLAAKQSPSDSPTGISVSGNMSISEPRGVLFVNELINACRVLGVDWTALPMLIKTFFVGYKETGDVEYGQTVDTISDIPGLVTRLINVTGVYTETGGVYNVDFVAFSNGLASMPQFAKAVDGITVNPGIQSKATFKDATNQIAEKVDYAGTQGKNVTIKQVLASLQDSINAKHSANYQCTINLLKQQGVADADQKYGKTVYVIDPGEYGDSKYIVCDDPPQTKDKVDCCAAPQFSFAIGTTIEQAIKSVIGKSPVVQQEGSNNANPKYIPTTSSSVTTSFINGKDGPLQQTIKWTITRQLVPTQKQAQDMEKAAAAKNARNLGGTSIDTTNSVGVNIDLGTENLITFNYIYSGMNTDVLSFDMKLNLGQAFLNNAVQNNVLSSGQFEKFPTVVGSPNTQNALGNRFANNESKESNTTVASGSNKVIMAPASQTVQVKSGTARDPLTKSQYLARLNNWGSVESISSVIKIVGNPTFLGSIARLASPNALASNNSETPGGNQAGGQQANTNNVMAPNFGKIATLCKINIYTPSTDDDLEYFKKVAANDEPIDYKQNFWYKGYYRILKVDNNFDSDGSFTQTLQLVAIPPDYIGNTAQPGAAQPQIDLSPCYGGSQGCQQQPQQSPPVTGPQQTPGQAPAPPVISQQIEDNLLSGKRQQVSNWQECKQLFRTIPNDPAEVCPWDGIPSDWKQAVNNAASRYNIPAVTLAMTISQESAWKPCAKNPQSSAAGLGQFINSTWVQILKTNSPEAVQGKSLPQIYELKCDPILSINMVAAYMNENRTGAARQKVVVQDADDYYLCHFLGLGGATATIRARDSGRGNITLVQAYQEANVGRNPTGLAARALRSNGFPANATVNQVCDFAATKIARWLKRAIVNGRSCSRGELTQIPKQPNGTVAPPAAPAAAAGNTSPTTAQVECKYNPQQVDAATKKPCDAPSKPTQTGPQGTNRNSNDPNNPTGSPLVAQIPL